MVDQRQGDVRVIDGRHLPAALGQVKRMTTRTAGQVERPARRQILNKINEERQRDRQVVETLPVAFVPSGFGVRRPRVVPPISHIVELAGPIGRWVLSRRFRGIGPSRGGNTTDGTGSVCRQLFALHRFLVHHRTGNGAVSVHLVCAPGFARRANRAGAGGLADWIFEIAQDAADRRLRHHRYRLGGVLLRQPLHLVFGQGTSPGHRAQAVRQAQRRRRLGPGDSRIGRGGRPEARARAAGADRRREGARQHLPSPGR